jgi:acetolactate synthase I/II/III large subunit
MTGPDRIAAVLVARGVRHAFGVPGGGSSSDVILAATACGIRFVLSQTETGGALMAAAQGEVTGYPGVSVTTLGPGVASVVNGVAHASLDRSPLLLLADAPATPTAIVGVHQRIEQAELLRPITKAQIVVRDTGVEEAMSEAFAASTAPPPGPVYVELAFSSDPQARPAVARQEPSPAPVEPDRGASDTEEQLRAVVAAAKRPLALIGLEVRSDEEIEAVRAFCDEFDIPALVTYKAKGVIPDASPRFAGVLTNATIERRVLERADLLIAIGLDPVELLARPWPHTAPVVDVGVALHAASQLPVRGRFGENLVDGIARVSSALARTEGSGWAHAEGRRGRALLVVGGSARLTPTLAISELSRRWAGSARATIDAGAHMLPAMLLWPAEHRADLLISNGLSTMGYALPAAIGAALLEPTRRVIALTGDGGLLMCLGELATLAREALDVCVVVFDDRALSLIKLKQEQRGRPAGVDLGTVDWPAVASAMGIPGCGVRTVAELRTAMAEADSHHGPSLLAIRVESSDYSSVLKALRG